MKLKEPFSKVGKVWNSLPETIDKIKNLSHYNPSVQRAPNLIQREEKYEIRRRQLLSRSLYWILFSYPNFNSYV